MRTFLLICRLVVGPLFIVSGLIKANDPLGFSYKLEEYFAESALNLPFLEPFALALAVLACLAEIVLGFAVIFGGRMKLATASLMVLTIFFGWLTAFTGRCNDRADTDNPMTYTVVVNNQKEERERTCVTDCGCFGDAMKGSIGRSLTPWESFGKDAILFVFILPLFIAAFRKPGIGWNTTADDKVLLPLSLVLVAVWSWVFTWGGPVWFTATGFAGYLIAKRKWNTPVSEWVTAAWTGLLTLAFCWWCVAHLPVRDYRPYAEGKSIAEQKVMGTPPVQEVFLRYKDKRTGEINEYDANGTYPWDDEVNFEFVDQRVKVIKEGVISPVQDFLLTDADGSEISAGLLSETTPVLLVMMYDVTKSATGDLGKVAALADAAYKEGWYVYGVSASPFSAIEDVRHRYQLAFDFLQCDEKTIKTAIRANPGIMLLKEGRVMGNWNARDTPSLEEAKGRL